MPARTPAACSHGGMVAGKLPYWMHQVLEYLIGIMVLFECARISRPAAPVLVAAAVLVLGALGDAPASAFRGVPRPVHRILDVVVAVVSLGLGAVGPVSAAGRVALVIVGVCLLLLAWRTDFTPKAPKVALRDRLPDSRDVGRVAGRAAGKAAVAGRSLWRNRKRRPS